MRVAAGFLVYIALVAALLFGGAGTIDWARGWALWITLVLVRGWSNLSIYRFNRELLMQRSSMPLHAEQPWSDRILLPLFMASFAGLIAFAGWDGFRGRLLPAPPIAVRPLGLIAFALGWVIIYFVLRANAFAVTVVRDQSDKGQRVIDNGPYAVVRHPMYASMIPVMLGMCCWLGSTAGMALSLIPMLVLAVRIRVEEGVLVRALADYAVYRRRVRWRLVPLVW